LTYEFPNAEDVEEDYRGKEILYSVAVTGIRERVLPELNEEFVKKVSDLENVEELREKILEDLATQKEVDDENTYVNSILDAILEDAEVKFPPQMVENEIEGEIKELEMQLSNQGMDLEMYLKIQDLDEEGLREQMKPNAEKRIRQGLIIGRISEAEELDIAPDDITNEFKSILDGHFGEDEKARNDYMQSGESVALLNRISSQMVTKKALDFLVAVAKGEDFSIHLKPEEIEEEAEEDSSEEPAESQTEVEENQDEVQENDDQQD
jgi:trigger factor